jgi:hypothetical protein
MLRYKARPHCYVNNLETLKINILQMCGVGRRNIEVRISIFISLMYINTYIAK